MGAASAMRLPATRRMRRAAQFKRTFARGARSRSGPFLAVGASRADAADASQQARLGLAISKKHAAKAVERNRVKRQVREDFRQRAEGLPAMDCVVCLRASSVACNNAELRAALDQLWRRVIETCKHSKNSLSP